MGDDLLLQSQEIKRFEIAYVKLNDSIPEKYTFKKRINFENLNFLLNNPWNYSVLVWTSYLIKKLTKNKIENVKYLDSGYFGNTFLIQNPKFVAKINKRQDETPHEAAIGFTLNKLKRKIPNFVFLYSTFKCNIPEENAEILCDLKKKNGMFIAFEFIPGVRLEISIKTLTNNEFFEIYLQILNALNIAWEECDFTHYDLHLENILIRDLDEPIIVPIYTMEGILYLKTRKIPYIIDYGFSHVIVDGISLDKYQTENDGVIPQESFPMYDVFFLFDKTLARLITERRTKKIQFEFLTEIKEQIFEKISKGFPYRTRNLSHIGNLTLDHTIEFLIENYHQYLEFSNESQIKNNIGWSEFIKLI